MLDNQLATCTRMPLSQQQLQPTAMINPTSNNNAIPPPSHRTTLHIIQQHTTQAHNTQYITRARARERERGAYLFMSSPLNMELCCQGYLGGARALSAYARRVVNPITAPVPTTVLNTTARNIFSTTEAARINNNNNNEMGDGDGDKRWNK
jgi:hypothetical protein